MRRRPPDQHRWKMWLDPRVVAVLEKTAKRLELSWEWDKQHPRSYPINTDHVLSETKAQLKTPSQTKRGRQKWLPVPAGPAKSVCDLIDERTVRTLYEQQHAGSYCRALRQASEGFGRGFQAWKKIANCLTGAYRIDYWGVEFAPKPKIHFLHRELLEIAELLELDQLTKEGLARFFDDICPCERKHNPEAIRKLGKRRAR
jgi:hypothetical protein